MRLSFFAAIAAAFSSIESAVAAPSSDWSAPAPYYFYKGFDLSSLLILEESNVTYKDTARHNETRPAEDILGDGGMNTVRLRLWVNPTGEYTGQYDLNYTLIQAQRFSRQGYKIYLDYHFSDTWADPSDQYPPAAWPTDLPGLITTLRAYVKDTLVAFKEGGVDLDLVSLGNEIRHGILWPNGEVNVDIMPESARIANFTNLAELLASARAGVSDAVAVGVKKPQVMIHIDDGWNKTLQLDWFGALLGTGKFTTADFDLLGVSFYPFYGTSATLLNLADTLGAWVNKYQKPVQVVETDWPEECSGADAPVLSDTAIPISVPGQIEWVRDIVEVVKNVPGNLGRGVNYWEPTWLNNTGLGSACQDVLLFEGDWSGWPDSVIGYSRFSVDMFEIPT